MAEKIGVGIIGAGLRGAFVLGARMVDLVGSTNLRVVALCDALEQRAMESQYGLTMGYKQKGEDAAIQTYKDYKDLVDDPKVDVVLVTTPTNFHLEPTEYALKKGKKVYLDKPIAVSLKDSKAIVEAEEKYKSPLIMGFTRRYETSWKKAYEILKEGAIGNLQMMNLRSVIPYSRYLHLWHRQNERSGGAFNDKCSHHFDVFNWFANSQTKSISAIGGKSDIFKEDPTAPPRCSVCDRDCPYNIYEDPDFKEMGLSQIPPSWANAKEEEFMFDTCVFKPGSDIYDHMICNVEYQNGVKANLFFTIFGPKAEDQESLELVGSKGRLILTRGNGKIDLIKEYGEKQEVIDTRGEEFKSSHFGADLELIRQIENFYHGEKPIASSKDGHESLRMIHAAIQSVKEKKHISLENKGEINEQF